MPHDPRDVCPLHIGHYAWVRRRAWATLAACAVAVAGLVAVFAVEGDNESETSCDLALMAREVMLQPSEVTTAALEDQGAPGKDHCDMGPVGPSGLGYPVLGFDCIVRELGGATIGTADANRADGTCGQDDP